MNRHSSTRRRHHTKNRGAAAFSLLVGSTLIGLLVFFASYSSPTQSQEDDFQRIADRALGNAEVADSSSVADRSANAPDPSDTASSGVVYPYSVVPGGVRSPEELRYASAHDPVVADHYFGFNFQKAYVVEVRQPKLVYVSYRIGDKVYWTAKKVSLHRGEKLITDGRITARGRCGNRVSELPQKKHSKEEPAIAQFDQPISGSSMRTPFPDNFHSALESRIAPGWGTPAMGPVSPLAFLPSGTSPLGGGYLPLGSPLAPGVVSIPTSSGPGSGSPGSGAPGSGGPGSGGPGSGGPGSGGPGSGGPGPGGPSTPVPEPGAFALFSAEIVAGILGWKFFYKRTAMSKIPK